MAVETAIAIQVRFRADTKSGVVQDAMYFAADEFAKLTPEDIEAMAQKRADDYVNNYIPPPGPTKQELQAKADDIAARIAGLVAEKAEVDAAIVAVDMKAAVAVGAIDG
jgi:hypothetical protein